MTTQKHRAGAPKASLRSTTKRRLAAPKTSKTRRARSEYPVHQRFLLHPLSMFIFLCTGVFMAGWTYHVVADTIISATIQAPPLQSAATIETPVADTAFVSAPIHVTGTCPAKSYVTLTANGAFSGVAWCSTNHDYQITTSLYAGTNRLNVQAYNITDSPGPASDDVLVTYVPPVIATPPSATAVTGPASAIQGGTASPAGKATADDAVAAVTQPLLLSSDFHFQTFSAQKSFSWNLDLEGGTPPYDVNVDWGDGSTSNLRFPTDPVFTIHHLFQTSGCYAVVVKSADTTGAQHTMQLAALITGSHGTSDLVAAAGNTHGNTPSTPINSQKFNISNISNPTAKVLVLAWPFYIVITLMSISFWLGEKREYAQVFIHTKRPSRRATR